MQPVDQATCPHEWETLDDPRFYNLGGFTPGETVCRLCGARQSPPPPAESPVSRVLLFIPLLLVTIVTALLLPLVMLGRRIGRWIDKK